jgi:hypothetical protein
MKWQPIETAPKDGTVLLGYSKETEPEHYCFLYDTEQQDWVSDDVDGGWCFVDPTHWIRIPKPPEE